MNQEVDRRLKKLKKGTLVKHGTTSRSLQGILNKGIHPKAYQYHFRNTIEEAPTTDQAVYVGQHMAYCAAMLSFMDLMMTDAGMAPSKNTSALPIVLNIKLGDDCLVVADEDFVLLDKHDQYGRLPNKYKDEFFNATREEGLRNWEEYGTAGIIRPNGIPATWIESFEHPMLKLEKNAEILSDIELMLLGYRQQQDGLSLEEITNQVNKFDIKSKHFSQVYKSTTEGLESYSHQEMLSNTNKRQLFCHELRNALVQLGEHKHGLFFHG